jgi:MFS family permease
MFLAMHAASPQYFSAWRFMTGIGIGGMLAAINAVAAEYSSLKSRSFAMALMVIGYPLGAFIGGLISQALMQGGEWRVVFQFGATMTVIFIPLVWLFIPETPAFLAHKQPSGALAAVNKTLSRFGHTSVEALPPPPAAIDKPALTDIFKPALVRTTIVLSLGYAFHAITFYYLLKNLPTIMSDPDFAGQHFTRPQGAGVLAWANLGGAIGGAAFGWFMHRFGIKASTIVALIGGAALIMVFGLGQSSLMGWTLMVVTCGLFTNAAIVGYYSAFAKGFPTHVRATGTGFALGIGRAGAALSPILAGLLFSHHLGLLTVSIVMALGSLVSAAIFMQLRLKD